jgi:phosphoketolase
MLRDTYSRNADSANFRLFCPDETNSNRLGAVFEVDNRCFVGKTLPIDDHVAPDGRVMELLSEHLCKGWLEGYLLTGRHGLFASYEAFAMIPAPMIVQHTKWLEEAINLSWREPTHTKPLTSPSMAYSCLPCSSTLQVTNLGRRAGNRAHIALDVSAVRSCGATVSPMPKESKQAN